MATHESTPSDETIGRQTRLFRALNTAADEVVLVLGEDLRPLLASASLRKLLGYDKNQVLHADMLWLIHADQRDSVADALSRGRRYPAESIKVEAQVSRADGTWLWMELVVQNRLGDPDLEAILFSGRDIEQRRRRELELTLRAEWFRAVTSQAGDYIQVLDENFQPLHGTGGGAHLFGDGDVLAPAERLSSVHEEDRALVKRSFNSILGQPGRRETVQYRWVAKHGVRHLESVAVNLLHDPVVHGIIVTTRDVTEQRDAQAALRDSEERYALVTRASNDGLWDWAIPTRQVYYSPRWLKIVGLEGTPVDPSPETWFGRVHDEDIGDLQLIISKLFASDDSHAQHEFRIRHVDGSWRWVHMRGLAVRAEDGGVVRFAGALTDISARMLSDGLTGLPNRALMLDRLGRSVERARRDHSAAFALIVMGLDRYHAVYASLGRASAERLVREAAIRVEDCLRSADSVARLDGDVFAVLLEGINDVPGVTRAAYRIHQAFVAPFQVESREIHSGIHAGVVIWTPALGGAEDVLRNGEAAMARAVASGPGRTELFDEAQQARGVFRIELEAELRVGIARDEIRAVFQPIVSIADGSIVGAEALARWHNPKRGPVSPIEFITLAEETDQIGSIGKRMLELACHASAQWVAPGLAGPYVAVNLSARQLQRAGIVDEVQRVIASSGLAPERVRLEVTETAIVSDPVGAARTLAEMRALGLRLALDDFGTGYSSLAYLHRFPFDVLKIDRSFVMTMVENDRSREICAAIIAMAQSLRLDVVAEGVETAPQRDMLRDLGCKYGQGWLFSKPMSADELGARIKRN